MVVARDRFTFLKLAKKLRKRGRFRKSGIFQKQLCLWAHEAQNAASTTQLRSVPSKKRGGFVGSGPSKPPFAPMRGVGEGEKSYKFMKPFPITPSIVGRLHNFSKPRWSLSLQEECQFVSFGRIPQNAREVKGLTEDRAPHFSDCLRRM